MIELPIYGVSIAGYEDCPGAFVFTERTVVNDRRIVGKETDIYKLMSSHLQPDIPTFLEENGMLVTWMVKPIKRPEDPTWFAELCATFERDGQAIYFKMWFSDNVYDVRDTRQSLSASITKVL